MPDENQEKIDALAERLNKVGAKPQPDAEEQASVASKRVGADFAGTMLGAGILGAVIDHQFETAPWGLIGFVLLGFVTGVVNAWRLMQKRDDE